MDGNFVQSKFHYPQGVVFQDKNVLFVADTGNHSIRRVRVLFSKYQPVLVDSNVLICVRALTNLGGLHSWKCHQPNPYWMELHP